MWLPLDPITWMNMISESGRDVDEDSRCCQWQPKQYLTWQFFDVRSMVAGFKPSFAWSDLITNCNFDGPLDNVLCTLHTALREARETNLIRLLIMNWPPCSSVLWPARELGPHAPLSLNSVSQPKVDGTVVFTIPLAQVPPPSSMNKPISHYYQPSPRSLRRQHNWKGMGIKLFLSALGQLEWGWRGWIYLVDRKVLLGNRCAI